MSTQVDFQKEYRIPVIDREQYAGTYWDVPVDRNHPSYNEPLVPLESENVSYLCYHARTDGDNPPYHKAVTGSRKDMWLRRSLAKKLAEVNTSLRPHDLELLILDGYRPIACQQGLWDFYYQQGRDLLGAAATRDELYAHARTFVADPAPFDENDCTTWPAHTTGASIDTTLRVISTEVVVDMGSNFEEITETSHSDYFERLLDQGEISTDDRRLIHRRILHWAMHRHGILNDPFVFWHHDWGNQHHVKTWRALFPDPPEAAMYGYIPPPPAEVGSAERSYRYNT